MSLFRHQMSGKRTRADNVDYLETAARFAFPKRNGRSVLARILILEGPRDTLEDIEVKL